MTWKEIVYMINDELKLASDDSSFNEDHIAFLVGKYRAFVLKQKYSDIKKNVPESNYQTICLDLETVPAISGEPCEGAYYLRSIEEVPSTMKIGNSRVFPQDYFQGEITYISRDRMRYIGYNKYLQNIIYCTKDPNGHLYFKSFNPQFLYLEKVKMSAIFEDIEKASELECNEKEQNCDLMDREFPIEDALVPPIIELVLKELLGASYRPEDTENNANDDLADLASFIRRNSKSNLAKQLE